jgi:hypothetical protein
LNIEFDSLKNSILEKQKTFLHRQKGIINQDLSPISQSILALCELAPFQFTLTVAGLHRAHPSTSLDKSYRILYSIEKLL